MCFSHPLARFPVRVEVGSLFLAAVVSDFVRRLGSLASWIAGASLVQSRRPGGNPPSMRALGLPNSCRESKVETQREKEANKLANEDELAK